MKDIFGKDIEIGQVGLHFHPNGGRAIACKVRITGFSPKRVRYAQVENQEETGTAIPEQFAILPASALDIRS